MSSILYYSNLCEHSKKLLQTISNNQLNNDVHFICIDKRVKDNSNKVYIILETGQKIIMPETVNRVPALLLLNQNYKVLYGDAILQYMRPKQSIAVKQPNVINTIQEPMAFSFGGSGFVASDQYSFLDMDSDELNAKGNGGMRQMHNYVDVNFKDSISTPIDETEYKKVSRMPEGLTVEQLQKQREMDIRK